MPKQRYQVMTRYMPMVGKRGLDMMYRTGDHPGEPRLRATRPTWSRSSACRWRCSRSRRRSSPARPSPRASPTASCRCAARCGATPTSARTGMLPFVFEPGMSFERYVDYALEVPMYFVYRGGRYIDVAGASFRDFLAGKLAAAAGRVADRGRLVGPPHHAIPRGAHEALPGDARRRRRALAAHLRAAGVLDGPALRRRGARCGLGPRQGLDRGGAPGAAQRRAEDGARDPLPGNDVLRRSHARPCESLGRAYAIGAASMRAPRTRPYISVRSTTWSRQARPWLTSCSSATRVRGVVISTMFSRNSRSK